MRAALEWARSHPAWAIWLLAVAVRVPIALATTQPGVDEAILFNYGTSWWRTGACDSAHWPATYQLVVGGMGMLVGARLAVELVFVLVGSLAVVPLHHGMRRLRGPAAAAWGAAGVALVPAFSSVINKSGQHSLFLPLLGCAFLLQVKALEDWSARNLVLLGVTLGALVATRADGVVVLGFVVASTVALARGARARARALVLLVVGALVLVGPYVANIHRWTGRWALSGGAASVVESPFYIQGLRDAQLERLTREFQSDSAHPYVKLVTHPTYTARKLAYNGRLFLRQLGDIYVFPAIFFAILGLAAARWLSEWPRGFWLLATWALPTLAFVALNVEARYFAPMAVFLMLFSGEGWTRVAEACGERRMLFRAIVAGAAAFLLACGALITLASRSGDEAMVAERAETVRKEVGDRLGETYVFNPHVRFRLDGRPGGPVLAPIHDRLTSRIYVVDPATDEREAESFDAVRGSARFRDWTADGLELHERTE